MPEIPELEHVAKVLTDRIGGRAVASVDIPKPIVIRLPPADFEAGLVGARFERVERSGKFLLWRTDRSSVMAVNPMLNGRFQWIAGSDGAGKRTKAHARTCFSLRFESDAELGLRYIDERYLGKVYLVDADALDMVPVLNEQGPDALDTELTQDIFLKRLKRYRGQVKNALVNAKFVAGIGNAYSDEILFSAGMHPFTKISSLSDERRAALYDAVRETLVWASKIAAGEIGDDIDRKPRDFLRVHRKGGEPCPTCGAPISEVSPNRRVTSFCRACQPM